MSGEKVTYALLSGDSAVTALVGTRIYPSPVPQDAALPCLGYSVITEMEMPVIDASAPYALMQSRMQVDVFAADYPAVKTLMDAVQTAMRYKRGTIAGVSVTAVLPSTVWNDGRDDLRAIPMQSVDFQVIFTETR